MITFQVARVYQINFSIILPLCKTVFLLGDILSENAKYFQTCIDHHPKKHPALDDTEKLAMVETVHACQAIAFHCQTRGMQLILDINVSQKEFFNDKLIILNLQMYVVEIFS